MRARGTIIVLSGGDLAISVAEADEVHDFMVVVHLHLHQSFEGNAVCCLLDLDVVRGLLEGVEEVNQLLVVDLEDGASDELRTALFLEDFFESSGDDTISLLLLELSEHCEGLARTCLSIGENCRILALEEGVEVSSCHGRVNLRLD